MISQVRLFWTLNYSSLIFQIHRSAIATPGLSPFGRGGYILLSPSHLAVTAPKGIGALSGFPYSRCARIPAPVAASDEALLPIIPQLPGGDSPRGHRRPIGLRLAASASFHPQSSLSFGQPRWGIPPVTAFRSGGLCVLRLRFAPAGPGHGL